MKGFYYKEKDLHYIIDFLFYIVIILNFINYNTFVNWSKFKKGKTIIDYNVKNKQNLFFIYLLVNLNV